jgi:DNA-binding transcriptional MerR regulator
MGERKGFTVGEVARLARVSVRALHHYDEIGLLAPSGRTQAGYRLYTDGDIELLQQVLFFRELGFVLDDVARILRDPRFDRRQALLAQRAMLVEKGARLEAMVALVDRTLESLGKGIVMSAEEMFDGDFNPGAYEEEARARWGKTDAYAESKKRTKGYTKEDWQRARAEGARSRASSPRSSRRGRRRPIRGRSTSSRSTGSTSIAGFTPARTRCTYLSGRCT